MRLSHLPVLVLSICIVCLIYCASGAAVGDDTPAKGSAPVVQSPKENAVVGPATLVVGKAHPGSLVVIQTHVYNEDRSDKYYRTIPGHRHRTNPDGSFALLIATPRVFFGDRINLKYDIHVFTATKDGGESPHTVIPVQQKSLRSD